MTFWRNKWLLAIVVFLSFTIPVWSKSIVAAIGIVTDTGQTNPVWWHSIIAYSAFLVPLDVLITAGVIYYFGKRRKG